MLFKFHRFQLLLLDGLPLALLLLSVERSEMPALREARGEGRLALAADEVVEDSPLQVPGLAGRLLDHL